MVPDILSWLGYCNSMLNPIIYAFTIREFKASVRRTLSFWKAHLPPPPPTKPPQPLALTKTAQRKYSAVAAALLEAGLVGPVVDPVWSAKAYQMLVNPQTTRL